MTHPVGVSRSLRLRHANPPDHTCSGVYIVQALRVFQSAGQGCSPLAYRQAQCPTRGRARFYGAITPDAGDGKLRVVAQQPAGSHCPLQL